MLCREQCTFNIFHSCLWFYVLLNVHIFFVVVVVSCMCVSVYFVLYSCQSVRFAWMLVQCRTDDDVHKLHFCVCLCVVFWVFGRKPSRAFEYSMSAKSSSRTTVERIRLFVHTDSLDNNKQFQTGILCVSEWLNECVDWSQLMLYSGCALRVSWLSMSHLNISLSLSLSLVPQ